MTYETTDQKPEARQPNVRPYHTPRLFVYGAMRELTAGGTGIAAEQGSPSNMERP